ncbi:hypothetical protein H4582DRAFT_2058843 [Lactarius indigo]|nr:hypothetical protein H4582DRAFT_2058843 [Lactarius indigo]
MELVQSNIRAGIELGTFPAPVEAEAFRACAIAGSMGLAPELENAARLTLVIQREGTVRPRSLSQRWQIVTQLSTKYKSASAFANISTTFNQDVNAITSSTASRTMRVANAKADKFPASSRKGRGASGSAPKTTPNQPIVYPATALTV